MKKVGVLRPSQKDVNGLFELLQWLAKNRNLILTNEQELWLFSLIRRVVQLRNLIYGSRVWSGIWI